MTTLKAANPPKVSILISTFNRAELTFQALNSIANQTYHDYEVVILDDGSDSKTKLMYKKLCRTSPLYQDSRLRWFFMPPRKSRLSNLSIARNNALLYARGELITFCDDDDFWNDNKHLEIAVNEFENNPDLDFYFANQQGVQNGKTIINTWQPNLIKDLINSGARPNNNGIYAVPLKIFTKNWTPHTNTSVFRRRLIDKIGGFWPYTPMEQDVDFLYRAADLSSQICYRHSVVAIHEIPDKSKKDNSSTRVSQIERYLFRLAISGHLMTNTKSDCVRIFSKNYQAYAAQKLALELANDCPKVARDYALMGFCLKPSFGSFFCWIRYIFKARSN